MHYLICSVVTYRDFVQISIFGMLMVMVMVMFRAIQNAVWNPYRMWRNSMPKHCEVVVVGGDQTDLL